MLLVELVVGLHQPLHEIDEIPEDLHAAHAEEVGWPSQVVLHGKDQLLGEVGELYCRVALIGGHAAEIVAAHLAAPLHHHLEIGLLAVCALNEVGHGRPLGDGAVAVAELPVVIALHARVGEVVGDRKGIYNGVGLLDFCP